MKRASCLTFVGVVAMLAVPALAQSAGPPELFSRALAHPAKRSLYAFDFADQTGGDKPTFTRGRIDPSKPKGQRVVIYEVSGKDWSLKDAKERYERNAKGDIWCDNLSYGADGPVTEKPPVGDTRIFIFTPVPKPNAKDDEKDLYRKLSAEMVVEASSGRIRTFNAKLTKAWKPVFIAKVDNVHLYGECTPAPDGRLYTVKLDTTLVGNVMGIGQTQSVKRTISNLSAVGAPG